MDPYYVWCANLRVWSSGCSCDFMQISICQGKTGTLEFLSSASAELGGIAKASPLESGRYCFFFCYSSVGLMCANLLCFQNWVFWGCVSQVEVLNIGVLDAGYKTFTQREAVSWDLPLKCMLPYQS